MHCTKCFSRSQLCYCRQKRKEKGSRTWEMWVFWLKMMATCLFNLLTALFLAGSVITAFSIHLISHCVVGIISNKTVHSGRPWLFYFYFITQFIYFSDLFLTEVKTSSINFQFYYLTLVSCAEKDSMAVTDIQRWISLKILLNILKIEQWLRNFLSPYRLLKISLLR